MPKVLEFILQEMFRRVDLADIYSLADPERCKRYIVVATDALESLFVKMRIYPNKGKDGTLYLQSIDGIMKSMPADIRAKQREYCVELAFFFIRIFQTFGALFLSMYDSRLPITDPTTDVGSDSPAKGVAFLNPKDFLGFSNPPQASSSWFGSGGALSSDPRGDLRFYIDDNNPYSILNHHISRPREVASSSPDISPRYPMRFDKAPFTIAQSELYEINVGGDGLRRLKQNLSPTIMYYYERDNATNIIRATLDIEFQQPTTDKFKVKLTNFTSDIINQSLLNGKTSESAVFGGLNLDGIPRTINDTSFKKGLQLPDVLKIMFDKVLTSVLGEPPFSVAKYLKKIGYLKGDTDTDQVIIGSSVYLLKNQENDNPVKVTYLTKLKIQGGDKERQVQIRNVSMSITKVSDSSLQMSFRVSLDYTLCDIKPDEYRTMITLPATNNMTFKANSEDVKPSSDANNLSIPEWLDSVFKKITSSSYKDDVKGFKITRAGLVEPYDSSQIRDELKVKKLWAMMAKDPPIKSHCVARAVQLLSLDALKGNFNTPTYTSICRLSFGYQKDGSLPVPGKPVIEEAGIYALSLLFFEGLERGAPKILDPLAYKEYLRYLKYLFERYPKIDRIVDAPVPAGQVQTNPDAIPSRLSDIREKSLKMCEDRPDSRLSVPTPLAKNLKSVTNNLFAQQAAHFKEALTLIFSLFDRNSVENDKKLKFNPRIIAGGMNEINSIASKTRELLLRYYKGCELTYRNGLVMIYNHEKSNGKLEATPVGQMRSGTSTTSTVPVRNNSTRTQQNNNDNNNLN